MLGQLGYNFHVSDNLVMGIQGDLQWSNVTGDWEDNHIVDTVNWDGAVTAHLGIDAGQLKVTMGGNPAFMRKEGAGIEMWRYDGAACKAFFFLYPQGGELSVRHVETIPRPSDAAADLGCLNQLRGGGAAS